MHLIGRRIPGLPDDLATGEIEAADYFLLFLASMGIDPVAQHYRGRMP